jgi:hypothetical protein
MTSVGVEAIGRDAMRSAPISLNRSVDGRPQEGARMPVIDRPKLDAREAHFCVPSDHAGLSLFLRYLAPDHSPTPDRRVVLYVHGATFPSALSIAHRFDGRSWRDELVACGFHTWALDFHGFGQFSDPYPEMDEPAENNPPLGRAQDASAPSASSAHTTG